MMGTDWRRWIGEMGSDRMRLKRCHASLGSWVFLSRAFVSLVVGSIFNF